MAGWAFVGDDVNASASNMHGFNQCRAMIPMGLILRIYRISVCMIPSLLRGHSIYSIHGCIVI